MYAGGTGKTGDICGWSNYPRPATLTSAAPAAPSRACRLRSARRTFDTIGVYIAVVDRGAQGVAVACAGQRGNASYTTIGCLRCTPPFRNVRQTRTDQAGRQCHLHDHALAVTPLITTRSILLALSLAGVLACVSARDGFANVANTLNVAATAWIDLCMFLEPDGGC